VSNLRWCIYRRATLELLKEKALSDILIAEGILELMPEGERMQRLRKAAAEEGEPTYFD
jgi:hypothetical protein